MAISEKNETIYTFDNVNDTVKVRRIGDFGVLEDITLQLPGERGGMYDVFTDGEFFLENPTISTTRRLFSGYIYDIGIFTWNLDTGFVNEDLHLTGYLWWAYYDPEGDTIFWIGSDGLHGIDLETRDTIHFLDQKLDGVEKSLWFSPDGNYLVLSQKNLKIFTINPNHTLELVDIYPFPTEEIWRVENLVISTDNELMAISNDQFVYILDFESGQPISEFPAHLDEIVSIAFSPDGRYIATSSWDGTIRIWGIPAEE